MACALSARPSGLTLVTSPSCPQGMALISENGQSSLTTSRLRVWARRASKRVARNSAYLGESKTDSRLPGCLLPSGRRISLSTLPPLSPNRGQKFIHLGSPKLREVRGADVVVVPAGKEAEKEFHQKTMFVKGKLFNLLALGLIVHPAKWADALRDCNVDTLLARIRLGGQHV